MWFLFRVKQPSLKPIVESTPPPSLPSAHERNSIDHCVLRGILQLKVQCKQRKEAVMLGIEVLLITALFVSMIESFLNSALIKTIALNLLVLIV